VNSQGSRVNHADHAPCEGQHTSRMDVLADQISDKLVNLVRREPRGRGAARRISAGQGARSRRAGRRHAPRTALRRDGFPKQETNQGISQDIYGCFLFSSAFGKDSTLCRDSPARRVSSGGDLEDAFAERAGDGLE
jgi:hypothetical protein